MQGYEIAAYMDPAAEVGGDYYDIINCKGLDWMIIGDVSGHGVPAGLIMMMVQTSIHTVLMNNPYLKPSELLTQVNEVLRENIKLMKEDRYMTITVFSCVENNRMFFSGHHQNIFIYRAQEKKVDQIKTSGMWLGLMDDIDDMNSDETIELNTGDIMLVYTDGITEALKVGHLGRRPGNHVEMFGEERLTEELLRLGGESPDVIKQGVLAKLESYVCDDDVTMVVLKKL